jgi:hypothetical protein
VPDRAGGHDHGIDEAVIVGELPDIKATGLLAQFLDTFGQFGEPLLLPLLQAPPNGSDEVTASAFPTRGTDPSAASAARSTISRPALLPGGVVSMREG